MFLSFLFYYILWAHVTAGSSAFKFNVMFCGNFLSIYPSNYSESVYKTQKIYIQCMYSGLSLVASYDIRPGNEAGLFEPPCTGNFSRSFFTHVQGGPKTKPLPNDQKIILNHIKACQWD